MRQRNFPTGITGNFAQNPYLPLWEHLPDGTPRVFEDVDNPGKYRVHIIGSHDLRLESYCGPDIRMWSAPVDDLANWRDDGPIFSYQDPKTGQWDVMYAPDMCEVRKKDGTREFYLYPHSRGPGREPMVAKADRPDGPFVPINVTPEGKVLPGSVIGFDPIVCIEYVTDPKDLDYEIGFRAYAFWGFQRAHAAQLDQNTMYSVRPGTEIIDRFIPASYRYGEIRDPEGTLFPHVIAGEDLTSFNYFEAFDMCKVGNKYVVAFSGYSGPDYGLESTNSALRYAFGDTPLGPWRSGRVLIDSRAPVLNKDGTAMATAGTAHNTHGGLQLVGGQWYVFYHRPPRGFGYARQAVVEAVHVEWDEAPVAEGGQVRIRAFDPYAKDKIRPTIASNGDNYTGAKVTSEGFHIFGLPPYGYYSAGIASYLSEPSTLQDNWDIWDNHMPVTNVSNGHIIGFEHFGFGGLEKHSHGIKPFEGTRPGNNTKLNVYLTPRTTQAFTIIVWLDGPWDNSAWNGKKIGEIAVPANKHETACFTVDVAQYVEGLDKKHAIFLVAEGGEGPLFDLIGLGFSGDNKQITRHVPPVVKIAVDGKELTLHEHPVRSTSENGITGYNVYEYVVKCEKNATNIPVLTASASDPDVGITIHQINTPTGTASVDFDYKGIVKTYNVVFEPWSKWEEPVRYIIDECNPVYGGSARVTFGKVIGYIDAGDPPGSVTFTVNVPKSAAYKMNIYHSTPWGEASHSWRINDNEPVVFEYPELIWYPSEFPQELRLNAGENIITAEFRHGATELEWIELSMLKDD